MALESEGKSYWSQLDKHEWAEIWQNHPLARAVVNELVTGDPTQWPIACLTRVLREAIPFARTASIGCGVGNLEQSLVQLNIVTRVTGIDYSETTIQVASERSAAAGLRDRIDYRCIDAREYLSAARDLDAIFFHSSLHHFERIDDLMRLASAALRPDGILYLDEYVGPSRTQWTWLDLVRWNRAYWSLPAAVRRTVIRKPINFENPTEAVNSADIVPAVYKYFDVLHRRDYGGNLLGPIYPSLLRPDQPNGPSPEMFNNAVQSLLRLERSLAPKQSSFHSVIVARPKATKSASQGGAA
jgi:SAM-dependent methyltransferase